MTEHMTYYDYVEKYEETDEIKKGSLLGNEVDTNFHILQGRTIKDIELTKDKNSFVINFLNGTTIESPKMFDKIITDIRFEYDDVNGELLIYINGEKEPEKVNNFLTKSEVNELIEQSYVFSDKTLDGDGTVKNPLKLSRMEKTGVYKPIIDIVNELPAAQNTIGDRYVINTTLNKAGSLYNYDGVMHIMKYLDSKKETSEGRWRVANRMDWADMLDAFETKPENRTHGLPDNPRNLGNDAALYLKKEEYGFNVNYCGYANYETPQHLTWCGKNETWWTASNKFGQSAFVKSVTNDGSGSVYQDIVAKMPYYSVRLVRDMDTTEDLGAEDIMNVTYPVVAMPSLHKGQRLWISVNFNSKLDDITEMKEVEEINACGNLVKTQKKITIIEGCDDENRFVPTKDDPHYDSSIWGDVPITYVCEWDGTKWIKNEISNYDTFFVINKSDFYTLINGKIYPVHGEINTFIKLFRTMFPTYVINEELTNAQEYVYTKYPDETKVFTYTGKFTIEEMDSDTIENKVNYSIEATKFTKEALLADMARFIGAIYRSNVNGIQVNSIEFGEYVYDWDEKLGNKGSNYVRHDNSGEIIYDETTALPLTLIKAITDKYIENPSALTKLTLKTKDGKFCITGNILS